ncbi:DMT family protein [Pectobacterium carotovorum]|uniref:DMT family protein n=1 Tax=Pectobacterium carotovorum TaxID=554 RepID=UPI003B981AD1
MIAALISWGIALFEYLLQVPANRIGYQAASAAQLKILQAVISLSVFIPFSMFILKELFRIGYPIVAVDMLRLLIDPDKRLCREAVAFGCGDQFVACRCIQRWRA